MKPFSSRLHLNIRQAIWALLLATGLAARAGTPLAASTDYEHGGFVYDVTQSGAQLSLGMTF